MYSGFVIGRRSTSLAKTLHARGPECTYSLCLVVLFRLSLHLNLLVVLLQTDKFVTTVKKKYK